MKIILNEQQYKRLFQEAMMDGFSTDYLKKLPSFAQKVKYCRNMLGEPIGNGSSRMVFQIDVEKVLKLAKNQKGIAQNEQEMKILNDQMKQDLGIFPKVYNASDTNNFIWEIAEYVLPAKEKDFKNVTGFNWDTVVRFIANIYNRYCYRNQRLPYSLSDEEYDKVMEYDEENSYFFHELEDYLSNWCIDPVGDYLVLRNWGMTLRNGEPYMIILDEGLSIEIYDKYYKKK